jgi:hypothetical protein
MNLVAAISHLLLECYPAYASAGHRDGPQNAQGYSEHELAGR